MRWLRRLSLVLLALVALPLLAAPAALLWANTGSGRATLAQVAAGAVPGLTIEGLEGPLPGRLGATRIALADADGVWLEVTDARIELDLRALLGATLRIRALDAARVSVLRAPAPSGTTPEPAAGESATDRPLLPSLPRLPVAVALDRLAIARIELGAPLLGQPAALALDGSGRLDGTGLTAALALRRLDAPGQASLRATLAPDADRLHAEIEVEEPAGGLLPRLAGQPDQPFTAMLRLDGPATGAALALGASLGPAIRVQTQGTVRAAGDGSFGFLLTGEARAAPLLPPAVAPLATPLGFALDLDVADRRLAVRSLRLTAPAATLDAAGSLDLGAEALDLTLHAEVGAADRFGALVPDGIGWAGIAADARVTGTLAAPELRLQALPRELVLPVAEAAAALGPAPRLNVQATLPGPRLDATLEGAAARLSVVGSLAEPVALTATLDVPRLEALSPLAAGTLRAEVRAAGRLADPTLIISARADRLAAAGRVLEGFDLHAEVVTPASAPRVAARLAGHFEGLPLSLDLAGEPEGAALRLTAAEARLGPARLSAAGRLDPAGPVFDGTARLEATDLAPLGRLAGIAGLGGRLTLDAQLRARDGQQGFTLRLDAPRLAFGGQAGGVQATVEGTPQRMDWSLAARGEPGNGSARGALAQEGGGWRLDLAALEAAAQGETVRLAAPTRVTLGADGGVSLPGLALVPGGGGRLAAAGRWGPERADLTVTLAALPLTIAGRFAPDLQPQGTLSAELRVTGPIARPELRASLRGDGLRSAAPWARGLPTTTLRATGSLLGDATEARAELEAGAAGRLTLTARLPSGFAPSAPLAATLDGGLVLAPLADAFLGGGADRVTGRLTLALRAEGTLGSPRFGGRAELTGGDYRNALYGARLADIGAIVTGEGTRLVLQRLTARPGGGGTITAAGSLDAGAPGLPADLTVTARDARPIVSDFGSATLNADLRLSGPLLGGGTLGGEVRVAVAELRLPESLPASVPVLTGVRVRGRPPPGSVTQPSPRPIARPAPAAAASPAVPLNLALRIVAPGNVWVRGRGVEAELGGTIAIGGTIAAPVPTGALTLRRGQLEILARRLTFTRGTIGFNAGTFLPELDLLATAPTRSATVTVAITGPAANPEVRFSSTPELPQDEVLARLLFDRATSNLSPFEIAQIAAAIAQLTGVGGGGAGALDRVRSALGLDRLGVGGSASGTGASVEAGRYVAPGVFLGVRQGTQGRTGVGVEVQILPRLKLEGQTATGPAGDRLGLSYEFEY